MFERSTRGQPPVHRRTALARRDARGSVLFVVNGPTGSAVAMRAERFAEAAPGRALVLLRRHGRARSLREILERARAFGPDLVYCVDLAAVPIAAAVFCGSRTPMIVDTGDYPSAFLRHVQVRWPLVAAARALEELAYHRAAAMVARSAHLEAVLRGQGVRTVKVLPDGVDLRQVRPVSDPGLRRRLGLAKVLTVGIAGRFTWHERLGGGLGSELIDMLALLRDLPVHGVLIGEGPGVAHLRLRAHEQGVGERLHVLGQVPYAEYGRYLGLIDVCLLTQTNDPASWIRTTGKLPGYLAAGRYMLASAVGTAADVLPGEMLVPYEGRWDRAYGSKLAGRVRELVACPQRLRAGAALRERAAAFSYERIAREAGAFIAEVLGGSRR